MDVSSDLCLTTLILGFLRILYFKITKIAILQGIGQFLTFDRISGEHLDDEKPLVDDPALFTNENYLLSALDLEKMLDCYTVLAARILTEFFPCLMPLAKVIPKHINKTHVSIILKLQKVNNNCNTVCLLIMSVMNMVCYF